MNFSFFQSGKFFLVCISFVIASCEDGVFKVPFIGLNSKNEEVTADLPFDPQGQKLGRMIKNMHTSTEEALADHKGPAGPWTLDRVDVGLQIAASFKVGPWGAKGEPSFRLSFKRRK
ncbi:MAG: hypothetical protein HYW48_04830 [Deltaproteobacteria bacterium]|nr:hypothetical protein [Deltaproteobacteria bacterium]